MEPDRRDRRTAEQHGLELPLEYRLFGPDRSAQEGCGRTLNMSSTGLLVAPDQQISKGLPIEIVVQLPAELKDGNGTRLLILGHVLRSGATGAAIKILRYGFIHVHHREPSPAFRWSETIRHPMNPTQAYSKAEQASKSSQEAKRRSLGEPEPEGCERKAEASQTPDAATSPEAVPRQTAGWPEEFGT